MVSWIFLLVCLVGAGLVWNVYRPRNGRYSAPPSFFLGWLTGELGLHHIFWQAVATLLFVLAGALDAWPGKLGLALALASWAALGLHYVRGFEVRGVVDRALREALGPDFVEHIRPELRSELSQKVEWIPILKPFPISHAGVQRTKNICYGRAAAQDLKLDVYRPASGLTGCPVFFYVHGGGWVIGSKDDQGLPLVYHLASKGWLCVNVNYRLSPGATFPEHLVDLKRALHWVRTKGSEWGADPSFVAVAGGSAGGHLAALLALTQNEAEYQPGFEDSDTSVQAAVPIYGVYDFLEAGKTWGHDGLAPFLERHVMKATALEDPKAFEKASPIHRITPDAPPFFVVHGEADTLVPAQEAREFVAAFRERARSPIGYAEIPGAQHAFEIFPSLRSQITRSGIEVFLAWAWSEHCAARERVEPGTGRAS
jgi:acetyl esterase/lipase